MKRQRHEWRERREDGEVRLVRASCFNGCWALHERLKHEEEYVEVDPIPLPDLEELRDVLWRKYQRNRVPYKNIEQLDLLLEEARELVAAEEEAAREEEE